MLRKMLQYFYTTLLPERTKQTIDLYKNLRLSTVEGFTEKKIIALSPHPDDDILACGGSLHLCSQRGAHVTSVYMTDGRQGSKTITGDDLVALRQDEAHQAAAVIGIDNLVFLDNRDTELTLSAKTTGDLATLFGELQPEAVFLPHLMDNHCDHQATNRIFCALIRSIPPLRCYAWGLWTPLPDYNLAIDVTSCLDVKKQAIMKHKTQLAGSDLIQASLSMMKYYSIMSGRYDGSGWAEVFQVMTSLEYLRLAKVLGWKEKQF